MKKKKWPWVLGLIAIVLVLATIIGPRIILSAARQPEVADEYAYSEYFFEDYESVRNNIKERIETLKASGYEVQSESYAVDSGDDLYIDTFYLPSTSEHENLIILTTGVHGMEGYIGSVMLDVFFEDIYEQLDRETTGVLVVANVNPYGMKYFRRYNENNVDLNRNFIMDWESFDLASNKEYPKVEKFLGPTGKMNNALWNEVGFYASLAKEAVFNGADTISDALLTGQYEYPEGVYYGGNGDEISTTYLKNVFVQCMDSDYKNLVHIDIHSGYGPRYNMIIFNSVYETMNEEETKAAFGYDYVLSYDSDGFYATTGDTTDYFYRLAESKDTGKTVFSTCFEFGTIGEDFIDTIISLKYTIEENRQHWYPTSNKVMEEVVEEHYKELYYPTETAWREKTTEDFKTAIMGVFKTKLN